MMTDLQQNLQYLCRSDELVNSGNGVTFDVRFVNSSKVMHGFAVRYQDEAHAYLNRCPHLGLELDWRKNVFFNAKGDKLVCTMHGARFAPGDGAYISGPCETGLVRIETIEQDGCVYWRPDEKIQPA